MAALTLPSFGDVSIARGGASEDTEQIGDFDRAFSGAGRSDTRATKQAWSFQTVQYPLASAQSIRDELLGTAPITVTGDIVVGSVDVHPRNISLTFDTDNGALTAAVSFVLAES